MWVARNGAGVVVTPFLELWSSSDSGCGTEAGDEGAGELHFVLVERMDEIRNLLINE